MKEGSDTEGVEAGVGWGGKGGQRAGVGWGSGGSVGYPFESWKLIQRADELTELCVSVLFCPAAPLTVRRSGNTYCTPLSHSVENMDNVLMNAHVLCALSSLLTY